MNISSNNIFAQYYKWINGELPNDLCSFFWGTLVNIALLPIVVVGQLISKEKGFSNSFGIGIFTWLIYFLAFSIGLLILNSFGYEPIGFAGNLLLLPLIGAVAIGTVIGLIVLFVYGGVKGAESSTVQDTVATIRGKYCTKITWK